MNEHPSAVRQAWAHREGLVRLRPLEEALWRPESVVARLQIAEAFNRFAIAHDEVRVDVLASCFTEQASFQVAEGSADPFGTHRGRDAIARNVAAVLGEQNDQRRHIISNVLLEHLEGDAASALAYGMVSAVGAGQQLRLPASVIYLADLLREPDGCWRFNRLFIGMDAYVGDKPDVPSS